MKNLISKLLIGLILVCTSQLALAKKSDSEKLPIKDKYEFTREEFKKAVMNEVGIHLKKIGKSKITDLAKEILLKEEELRIKSIELDKLKEQHNKNVTDLDKKISGFNKRQSKLLSCLDEVDQKNNERISHMVQVISGMKPNVAAEVLSVQDSQISIKILGMLKPDNVSKIFNLMDKEVSARLQKQYMTMKK